MREKPPLSLTRYLVKGLSGVREYEQQLRHATRLGVSAYSFPPHHIAQQEIPLAEGHSRTHPDKDFHRQHDRFL